MQTVTITRAHWRFSRRAVLKSAGASALAIVAMTVPLPPLRRKAHRPGTRLSPKGNRVDPARSLSLTVSASSWSQTFMCRKPRSLAPSCGARGRRPYGAVKEQSRVCMAQMRSAASYACPDPSYVAKAAASPTTRPRPKPLSRTSTRVDYLGSLSFVDRQRSLCSASAAAVDSPCSAESTRDQGRRHCQHVRHQSGPTSGPGGDARCRADEAESGASCRCPLGGG